MMNCTVLNNRVNTICAETIPSIVKKKLTFLTICFMTFMNMIISNVPLRINIIHIVPNAHPNFMHFTNIDDVFVKSGLNQMWLKILQIVLLIGWQ